MTILSDKIDLKPVNVASFFLYTLFGEYKSNYRNAC